MLAVVARRAASDADPVARGQWVACRRELEVEVEEVRALDRESRALRAHDPSRPALPPSQLDDERLPLSRAVDDEDPDVWRPATGRLTGIGPGMAFGGGGGGGQHQPAPRPGDGPGWGGPGGVPPPRVLNARAGGGRRMPAHGRVGSAVGHAGQDPAGRANALGRAAAESRLPPGAAGGRRRRDAPSSSAASANAGPSDVGRRVAPTAEEVDVIAANFPPHDQDLARRLAADVLVGKPGVKWESVAGLREAKRLLEEAVVLPLLMPDFFQGIRRPYKGVLMFGPPGTGKTLLAKAVATECDSTFLSVSSSTMASKWRGESERMVKILFALARAHAPSVVFIDEIDALCTARGGEGESDADRKVKTEFLTQIDGAQAVASGQADGGDGGGGGGGNGGEPGPKPQVTVLAATNFPWQLDEALRRRLEKRVYIELPGEPERRELLDITLRGLEVGDDVDLDRLAEDTAGYSGDDVTNLVRDAAMNGMRRKIEGKTREEIRALSKEDVQEPVTKEDFRLALGRIRPSVAAGDVEKHVKWREEFGSG